MKDLSVNETSAEVSVDTIVNQMINDLREMNMDGLKHVIESMYPVVVEDVEGLEGEVVDISVDFQGAPGLTLKDIF